MGVRIVQFSGDLLDQIASSKQLWDENPTTVSPIVSHQSIPNDLVDYLICDRLSRSVEEPGT